MDAQSSEENKTNNGGKVMVDDIQPLKKELFERAEKMGLGKIILNFSGGSDEGYLQVEALPKDIINYWNWRQNSLTNEQRRELDQFTSDVEEWAYDAYCYNGAGDGNSYGDDIEYDLVEKTATVSEWWTERQQGDYVKYDLADAEEEVED
jgi:hypothetical protein